MKKCRFIGFAMVAGASFPKNELIKKLSCIGTHTCQHKKKSQYVELEKAGEYICGRIITFQTNHPRVLADAKLEAVLDHVPDGMNQVSYNYFVFHTGTFHGLYAYYTSSVPFIEFGNRLERICKQCVKNEKDKIYKDAKQIHGKMQSKPLPKKIKDDLAAQLSLTFTSLIRREKMNDIISTWKQVSAFRYLVSTTQVEADNLGALAPHTKSRVQEIRLETSVSARTYGNKIASFLGELRTRFGDALKRTSLIGINEAGAKKTVILGKITDEFGDVDLSVLHEDVAKKHKKVSDSTIVKHLLAQAEERPDYFSKVVS